MGFTTELDVLAENAAAGVRIGLTISELRDYSPTIELSRRSIAT